MSENALAVIRDAAAKGSAVNASSIISPAASFRDASFPRTWKKPMTGVSKASQTGFYPGHKTDPVSLNSAATVYAVGWSDWLSGFISPQRTRSLSVCLKA